MGRIKEYDRKSAKRRSRRPVIYIVCEGEKTEINYFRGFKTRYCNIDIQTIESQYKSADGLVEKAKATLGTNAFYPEDGDELWCVFDRDENNNSRLAKAVQMANKLGYQIAFSNPSIELWFLLHFCNHRGYLADCDAVIRLLEQPDRLPDYQKGDSALYNKLLPLQTAAIKNAEKRLAELAKAHVDMHTVESNPATTVVHLVKHLNKIRETR